MLSLDTKANRHPLPFAFSPIGAIILGKLFFLLLALITRPQSGRECKIESHESNAPRSSSAKSRYVCRRKPRTRWWGSDYVCRWGATRKPIDDDINCGLRGRPTFATNTVQDSSTYLPTKFSSTELLPADWPPTTAICGRSSCMWTPNDVNASCNLFTIGINCSMPTLVVIVGPRWCWLDSQMQGWGRALC